MKSMRLQVPTQPDYPLPIRLHYQFRLSHSLLRLILSSDHRLYNITSKHASIVQDRDHDTSNAVSAPSLSLIHI